MHGISTIYISAFMPLKYTFAFLEIWSKLYPVWKLEKEGWVRKTQILTNLKSDKLLRSYAYWKVDIFSYRPMQIAKNSDQFENSAFVIVGN